MFTRTVFVWHQSEIWIKHKALKSQQNTATAPALKSTQVCADTGSDRPATHGAGMGIAGT